MTATPGASVAERLTDAALAIRPEALPERVREVARSLVLDVVGLCVAARRMDYIEAIVRGSDPGGPCTAIGHEVTFSPETAALINGTATHGEDFDDTFEGGPVHSSAVVVPAVLAACERFALDGRAALAGMVAGTESLCRMSMVVPKAIHRAGFHPTSVLGVMGATLGVAVAMQLDRRQTVDALGIAGSFASGIIEYLAEGAWTKRMHPGWAAQAALQAARYAQQGFLGPRTVFEGTHGLFNAFAHTTKGDYDALLADFGTRWVMQDVTFKPYATGTMNQPYIDCALRLARRGLRAADVASILCETAEGYLHRLWDPLPAKHRPANAYAAKFSTPFNIAVAIVKGDAGLGAFTEQNVRDDDILGLASKVSYVVDPNNPYPKAYTGHIRVTLKNGQVIEERQPHIRGGAHEPLSAAEIEEKFRGNCAFGGWDAQRTQLALALVQGAFTGPVNLAPLRA